ncbi:ABC transporter permease [Amycolatopsis sp. FBCC-B4732]|uniref:ABC transporter permease n=1 Tax=Amycolatopsis sp. FBCC-B4732 TaxID=3079339 RepID=UPI001FF2D5D0|nr:ABC transporter permease [Amycolatopsis sp. FBCC-B4732]UOX90703.1 ABC transporter permease [Amycolatopsis sp. FBCC-B4732]
MISSEQTAAAARLGVLEYLAANPWRIIVTTQWPLALAQCLFYTVLGDLADGPGDGSFAFVGSLGLVLALSTVGGIGALPGTEKWGGTFHRLHLSGLPPAVVFGLRSLPYLVNGVATVVLCLMVIGPVTGHGRLSAELVPALPVLVLMAFTTAAAGLAAASPAMGRRSEVVITNGLMYLLVVTGGVLIPAGTAPVLDTVGTVLPLRHGFLAVRALLDGRSWLAETGLECLVGVGWAGFAHLLYRRQFARARRLGTDDFA